MKAGGALRLHAVCAEAARHGLKAGMTLAEARAILPGLETRPADPEGDAAALERLARWATRYSPRVAVEGAVEGHAGLWIDATGCAHLMGGERAMLDDITTRLGHTGIEAKAAMAATPGAAWALARHRPGHIAQEDETVAALAPLPVRGLRLGEADVLALNRLGLKTIGDLMRLDRAALARRFKGRARAPLERLDQALGRIEEPIEALLPLLEWRVQRPLLDPVTGPEPLEAAIAALLEELAGNLDHAGHGLRRLAVTAFRVDGTTARITAGTRLASRDPHHLMRLLKERIGAIDPGFGIDLIILEALETERIVARQLESPLAPANRSGLEEGALIALVERLAARLGEDRVLRLAPRARHIPERAQSLVPATKEGVEDEAAGWDAAALPASPRPLRLLPRPEPIEVLAALPEGAPLRFRWRGTLHRVVKAEGPERLGPEWWHEPHAPSRDYYRLEDEAGGRFWVFRAGLYAVPGVRDAEPVRPGWHLHGFFA